MASSRGRIVDSDVTEEMIDAGLLGLEIDHRDNPEVGRAELRRIAARNNLLVTGSSDYHGSNKTTPIAACTTAPDQYEALLAAGTGAAPFPGTVGTPD